LNADSQATFQEGEKKMAWALFLGGGTDFSEECSLEIRLFPLTGAYSFIPKKGGEKGEDWDLLALKGKDVELHTSYSIGQGGGGKTMSISDSTFRLNQDGVSLSAKKRN